MSNIINKYKWCIVLLLLTFSILVYCSFNTFIINDDLPYSLFFRADNRITNIGQIIANQFFDYFHVNARIIIHGIVQFLLMFDKTLWSFLNPLVIILIAISMSYIIYISTNKKTKPIYLLICSLISFLLLFNYKKIIYWVAGSVNYVWVFLLLLLFIIYYIKNGLLERPKLSFALCFFGSMICESLAIFIIVLIICDFLINEFIKKNKQRDYYKYLWLLVAAIIGFSFILFAPSTLDRFEEPNILEEKKGILNRIFIAIPLLSQNIFNPVNLYNLIPLLLIISIVYYLIINRKKEYVSFIIFISLLTLLGNYYNNGWLFLILSMIILLFQSFILIKNNNFKLFAVLLGAYAITYSLIVTPVYGSARISFHTMLLMSMFTIYNFTYNKDISNFLKFLAIFVFIGLLGLEIYIYTSIGNVKRIRERNIMAVQRGETKILEMKVMNDFFSKFHMDPNSPMSKEYWAYKAFEDYYSLPDDITIKPIK